MRVLAELKDAGAFGTIMHVEGNYSHDWLANYPADSWRMAAEESRAGGMTGMGIHVLDCFRDLVGPMKRISALSKARALKLPTGDTTAALIEFESGATGTLATTIKTPFDWRIAVYGENCRAESVSETRAIVRRAGKEPEMIDWPADNHLGRNLDYFAKAALGQGAFPIDARRHLADGRGAGGGVQVGGCRRGVDDGLTLRGAQPFALLGEFRNSREASPAVPHLLDMRDLRLEAFAGTAAPASRACAASAGSPRIRRAARGSTIGLTISSPRPMSLTEITLGSTVTQSERATNSSVAIMASISSMASTSTPWLWK